MTPLKLIAALSLASLAGLASAQSVADYTQRDINQETRIRNGLQDGSLTTREAALLQRRESQVDRLQSRDLKDGKLTAAERQRLNKAEDRVSQDIHTARTNGVNGNPLSASSQRLQEVTQRDINQETRIENGIKDGQLTNREVGRLEGGQAKVDQKEFRAGRDGHVGPAEATSINRSQDVQSARIHNLRTNGIRRHG